MKLVLAFGLVTLVSACAAAPRYTAEPDLRQRITVECVASNMTESGCETKHEIAIVTTIRRDTTGLPSLDDLRDQQPAPDLY